MCSIDDVDTVTRRKKNERFMKTMSNAIMASGSASPFLRLRLLTLIIIFFLLCCRLSTLLLPLLLSAFFFPVCRVSLLLHPLLPLARSQPAFFFFYLMSSRSGHTMSHRKAGRRALLLPRILIYVCIVTGRQVGKGWTG